MTAEKKINTGTIDIVNKLKTHRLFAQISPIIFLVILVVFFSIATGGRFTRPTSLKIIFDQALIVGTVSTGAAFIFSTGNVNLAMGATTVLTATLAGMIYNATQSFPLMLIFSIAIGIFIMVLSALLSTVFKVRVMFVTIVMMSMLAALQQTILGGTTVSIPYSLITQLNKANFSYIIFGIFFTVSAVLFHFTEIGRSLKMLGTNEICAEQTGIRKSKYLVIAFLIAGVGCGIGALLAIVRAGSIGDKTLTSLNMDCMLALVLGGMSIFGGSRSFSYSGIVGAITVCVLNQGMLMINVNPTIIQGVRGILFLILICTAQKRPQGLPAPEG